MDVAIKDKANWLIIETNVTDDENFNHQLNLYYKILSKQLLGSQISLITLKPQSYSLAYETKGLNQHKKIAGKSFLLSSGINCDKELLLDIIRSEEFRRGLLFLTFGQIKNLEMIADNIVGYLKVGKFNLTVKDKVYFTENDGNTLCLYNTKLTKEELLSISSSGDSM